MFGTLHTSGAEGTVNRIIDVFPTDQQEQIRTQLSTAIIGVLSQALLARKPKGMVAAYEMLVVTPAIANLIRERSTYRIPSRYLKRCGTWRMQAARRRCFNLVEDAASCEEELGHCQVQRT